MNDVEAVPQATKRRRRNGLPKGRKVTQADEDRLWLADGVIVAGDSGGTALLWRALEAISWERRWLVWVAPPRRPSARELRDHGLDLRHVLCITLRPEVDPLVVVERALASGHCSAVLAWPAVITEARLTSLQAAARQGQSLALLYPSLERGITSGRPASMRSTGRGSS
ncbi:MAG: SulA-like leucine-rich domain-containing protein [Candidatus Competibacteraceae bacterium]